MTTKGFPYERTNGVDRGAVSQPQKRTIIRWASSADSATEQFEAQKVAAWWIKEITNDLISNWKKLT